MYMRYQLKSNVEFDLDNPIESLLEINGIDFPQEYIDAGELSWHNAFDKMSALRMIFYSVAEKIGEKIDQGKRFGILVDCDVDGYTSASLVYNYLKKYKVECTLFFHEGKEHGLDDDKVFSEIENAGIDVLIIPDASGDAIDIEKLKKDCNIDTYIIDHHDVDMSYVDHGNIINPFLFPNTDKYTDLSGCAVVGVLRHFICDTTQEENELIALSLISDSMECRSIHNRYLLDIGFDHHPTHPLLKAIVDSDTYNVINNLDPVYCAFNIIPRLNAIIRMGKQEEKEMLFKALCCEDEVFDYTKRDKSVIKETIYERVARLGKNAQARQRKVVTEDADNIAQNVIDNKLDSSKILIITDDGSLNSVTKGISASKVSEKFNRPVVIGSEHNGVFSGSIRNSCDYIDDFKAMLDETKLCTVEGHSNAAGIKFNVADEGKIIKFFDDTCNAKDYVKTYYVDAVFNAEDIDDYLANQIGSFKKYQAGGIGEAKFAVKHVKFDGSNIETMSEDKHCKWTDGEVTYVKFNYHNSGVDNLVEDWYDGLVTVVGSISLNAYDGIYVPQVKVEDIEREE